MTSDYPMHTKENNTSENVRTMLVSIVLYTTGKGYRYINQAIDSCLNQTYAFIELIIVNDGADDKTRKCIEKYKDSRIKVIHHKKALGLGKALNEGFSQAKGQYFSWILDMHYYETQAIEQLVNYIALEGRVDFIYTDYYQLSENNGEKTLVKLANYLDFMEENVLGPGVFYSSKLYRKIGLYNRHYGMAADYDYWLRVTDQFAMIHYDRPLVTAHHVPYYGETKLRIYGHLFSRLVRYQNGFIKLENLEKGIWDFQDRIKRASVNNFDKFIMLSKAVLKMYSVSFKMGAVFHSVLIYITYKKHLEPLLKNFIFLSNHLNLFFIGCRLKKDVKNTNVLCLIPEVVVGGSEKVVMDIIKGIGKDGYQFHLLAIEGETNAWVKDFLKRFLNVVLFKKEFNNINNALDEQYYSYLQFLVKKLNIKIILISNPHAAYRCLPRLKTDFKNLKVLDLIHVEKFCASTEETFPAIAYIDKRVCISHGLKEHMKDKYQKAGIDSVYFDRLTVIHNANDMDFYKRDKTLEGIFKNKHNISKDTKIISYIGRLSSEKRPTVFVDVAKQVIDRIKDKNIKFVIAGDGLYMKAVKDRIRRHGIGDYFIFLGMVDSLTVRELLMDTYLVLIVSSIEGLPLVSVEAMAIDVPVISTDVGSISEAIKHGENGFLVHPQDQVVDRFADIVVELCESQEKYESLAGKTRQTVEKEFSLTTFADKYMEIFNQLK